MKSFDWCDAMDRRFAQNLATKFIIDMLEESVPTVIHSCPYTDFIFDKISLKTKTVGSLFPSGSYKTIFTLRDSSQNIFGSVLVVTINSTIKDTFGGTHSFI